MKKILTDIDIYAVYETEYDSHYEGYAMEG